MDDEMREEMRTELSYENAMYWANRQYELLREQAAFEVRITVLEYELDVREKDMLGAITSEREDGKPRFSNEQARKAELVHRLEMDEDYQRMRAELNMLTRQSLHLQREAKYASKIVEIMCTFAQKQQEPLIPVPASLLASLGRSERSHGIDIPIPRIEDLGAEDDESSAA